MEQVPEIVSGAHELNANAVHTTASLRDVHDAALALFLSETVHQQDGLARNHRRGHRDISAKRVHTQRACAPAERLIVGSAAIHLDRNTQRQPLAAAVRWARVVSGS